MVAFGAVEIPIAVPAADETLSILAKIDAQAQKTGDRMRELVPPGAAPAMGRAGEAAQGLEHRIGHLGVAGSFAFTNLATGSEGGLTRVAHSLAMFGGAFGGAGLIITTFIAVAGEKLLQFWHKSQEEADKAAKSNQKFLDSAGESKNLTSVASRQVQLFSGSEYTTEQDPLLAAGIRAGGLEAAYKKIEDLKTRLASARKAMDDFQGGKSGAEFRKLKDSAQELSAELKTTTEQMLALAAAYEKVSKLTGALTKGAVKKEGTEDRIAHQHEMENAQHSLMQAEAKDNYDALIVIADDWVDRMKKEYGEDSKEYVEAVREKTEVANQARAHDKSEEQKAKAFIVSYDEAAHRVDIARAGEHYSQLIAVATAWVDRMRELYGVNSEQYNKALAEQLTLLKEHDQKVKAEAQQLANGVTTIVSGTLEGLYSNGLQGGLRALGDSILKALGGILVQIGEKMLAAAPIFQVISAALLALDGTGLALGGLALIALGSAMGAVGGGGGHGGGGNGGPGGFTPGSNFAGNITARVSPNYAPNTAGVTAKPSTTINFTSIGTRDPKVQREILELIQYATDRKV